MMCSGTSISNEVITEFLQRLHVAGAASRDEIMRWFLEPHEVYALMPETQRQELAERMVNAMLLLLDTQGESVSLEVAKLGWSQAEDDALRIMDWTDFPPAVMKRCEQAAEQIIKQSLNQGWLEPRDWENETAYIITPRGIAASQNI